MLKYFLHNIVCLFFSVFLLLGCEDKTSTPLQPKVITKKLVIKKDISVSDIPEPKPKVKIEKTIKKTATILTEKPDKAGREMALKPQPAAAKTMLYNPEGKIDPFAPLFKEEKLIARDGESMKMGKAGICIPHTPLQKVNLSQLKLTGIIRASSGNRAMVEEASGKGYLIEKDTFIGINCGRVAQILTDRIIVDEPLLPVEDVDRRLLRQVLNKLRGEHLKELDAEEFRIIVDSGAEEDLKYLLGLSDEKLQTYFDNKGEEVEYRETFEVVVSCRDEAEQEIIYNKLRGEGYKCRVLTL